MAAVIGCVADDGTKRLRRYSGRIEQGMRFSWTCHDITPDVLFDIALNRRAPHE